MKSPNPFGASAPERLPGINRISVACHRCDDTHGFKGSPHSVKKLGKKVVVRCLGCGHGYAVRYNDLPPGAPVQMTIDAITRLIITGLADILPPNFGSSDEEETGRPE